MYWEIRLREDQSGDVIKDTLRLWIIPFHQSHGVHFETPIRGALGIQVHGWNLNLRTSMYEIPTPETEEKTDA